MQLMVLRRKQQQELNEGQRAQLQGHDGATSDAATRKVFHPRQIWRVAAPRLACAARTRASHCAAPALSLRALLAAPTRSHAGEWQGAQHIADHEHHAIGACSPHRHKHPMLNLDH